MTFLHKKLILKILFIIFLIFILSFALFNFNFLNDESFTMALVHHSFFDIAGIDSYDVHPPLYYLILKLYLVITTFWTSSIFIKMIFARILSLIMTYLSIILMLKILKVAGININYISSKLIYVFMFFSPSVIYFSSFIRMYSMGSFFVVYLLYRLCVYDKQNSNSNLIFVICFAIISAYIHYYVALVIGLLIIIFSLKNLFCKKNLIVIKLFIADIILVISYAPWLIFTSRHLMSARSNINLSVSKIIKQIVKIFIAPSGIYDSSLNSFNIVNKGILILLFYYICLYGLIWSLKHLNKSFNFLLLMDLFLLLFVLCIGSIADVLGYEFLPRYIYPLFFIECFMFITVFIKMYISNNQTRTLNKTLYIFILLLLILGISGIKSVSYNIYNVNNSLNIIKLNNRMKRNKANSIFLKKINAKENALETQSLIAHKSFEMSNIATYAYYNKKEIYSNHKIIMPIANRSKLSHKVWPNIK